MRAYSFWRLLPGAALILLASAQSHALTLGRIQGAAVIGRPLDVSVPVGLGAGTTPADFCPQLRVLYGDSQVDARTLDIRPGPGQDMATLRVRVAAPVNEPFVTVFLDVGCTSRLTREYVLLADHPGDVGQPAPLAAAMLPPGDAGGVVTSPALSPRVDSQPIAPLDVAPQAASAASFDVAAAAPVQPLPAEAAAQPAPQPDPPPAPAAALQPVAPAPVPAAARQPRVARAPVAASRPPAPAPAQRVERPRLRLDAPQIALSPPAAATATGRAAAVPAVPAPVPPPAPAQALPDSAAVSSAAQPAAAAQADRLSSLESDVLSMRAAMAASNLAMAEMRARLERAERERFANPLVYALLALLAAASMLAGLFWHRSRRSRKDDWWQGQPPTDRTPGNAQTRLQAPSAAPAPVASPHAAAGASAAPAGAVALSASSADGGRPRSRTGEPVEPALDDPTWAEPPSVPAGGAASPQQSVQVAEVEPLTAEMLAQVQQSVAGFLQEGGHERAIDLLRSQIDVHPQGSALPWLSLLEILSRLGQRDEHERVRGDYEWLFNSQAPAFGVTPDSSGLEEHPAVLAQLLAVWGTPQFLPMVDKFLLHQSEALQGVDAEFYRDLLMLRAVALDAASTPETPVHAVAPATATAAASVLAGTSALAASQASQAAAPLPVAEPESLDINLDDLLLLPPDLPADASTGPAELASSAQEGNLLDFDFELGKEFKPPARD